jgi:uncharacterized tellurite resistance protein B-like protein
MSESEWVLETAAGPLRVGSMHEGLVNALGARWPLPIATILPKEDAHTTHNRRATFLVPFEHEGHHINLIYLAQTPRSTAEAEAAVRDTEAQAEKILLEVIRAGFPGLLVQASTLRDSGGVGVPGLALVVGEGEESGEDDPNPLSIVLEMISSGGLDFHPVAPPKYVTPSVAGELSLGFGLLEGKLLICFKPELDPADPSLARLVAAGVSHIVHMPVTATSFPDMGPALPTPEAPPAEWVSEVSANGLRRIYRLLAHLAACDGTVDAAERALLNGVAERFRLEAEEVQALESEGFAGKGLKVGRNPVERELLMMQLIEMALADGVLDPAEKRRLKAFADKVGLPREELRRRLDERRVALKRGLDPNSGPPSDAPKSPNSLRRIYRLLCYLAGSDGEVGPAEEELLDSFRRRYGLSESEAFTLRSEGLRGEGLEVGKDDAERNLLLDELVAIAAADGEITQAETRRLRSFCKLLQVPLEELERRLHRKLQSIAAEREVAPPSADQGRVVILDAPTNMVGVNLLQVSVLEGFHGFKSVEPGLHRFAVVLPDGSDASHWVRLLPGEVEVLAFANGSLRPADSPRWTETQRLALSGRMDQALEPFPVHLPWRTLTHPLLGVPFPPKLFSVPDPLPAHRLENAFMNHEGSAGGLLAEVAFTFLLGLLDLNDQARGRWVYLVQALYHCGESLPKQAPTTFTWVVELLIAQQSQLSQALLGQGSQLTEGSHYLSEDLIDTELPELVEAGRRWAVFIAGHHAGAPSAEQLPLSMSQPSPDSPYAGALEESRIEIEALERELGRLHPDLVTPYSLRGRIQESAGDIVGALASQERMVEIGAATGTGPHFLAQGYARLARLLRQVGRALEADQAERASQRLALEARRTRDENASEQVSDAIRNHPLTNQVARELQSLLDTEKTGLSVTKLWGLDLEIFAELLLSTSRQEIKERGFELAIWGFGFGAQSRGVPSGFLLHVLRCESPKAARELVRLFQEDTRDLIERMGAAHGIEAPPLESLELEVGSSSVKGFSWDSCPGMRGKAPSRSARSAISRGRYVVHANAADNLGTPAFETLYRQIVPMLVASAAPG